jgi:peptide/nickel transport system permease protein
MMLAFKLDILLTDKLIYVLLAVIALLVWRILRHEHLRAPWRRVAQSQAGMAAAVILIAFVAVGLLDSVHFRHLLDNGGKGERQYASEVLSLLDVAAAPLRERVEKTYSAPFAAQLYAKETIELPGGRQVRDFPRLKYGGAHLKDPERERGDDIQSRAAGSLSLGFAVWAVLATLCISWLARCWGTTFLQALGQVARGESQVAWRAVLLTSALVILVGSLAAGLCVPYHIFGTDKVGQDVFYHALKSIRTGLVIGTLTTLVMLPFALLLGIVAGYMRGWVDDVIQYVYTTLNSIPGVLLIAAAVLIMQGHIESNPDTFDTVAARSDFRLLFLCLILGVTNWTGLCRLLRGEALKLSEMDYIQAARAFGVSHWRIISRHILPNVFHIVLISVVLDFSGLVLAEAVLSYVGVGVDPTMQSWGNMINSARLEMAREPIVWWQLAAAFAFMFVLVLAANIFADAVRDAFDPRAGRRMSAKVLARLRLGGAHE